MRDRYLRAWNKAFDTDIDSIVTELKDMIKPPAVLILSGDLGVGKTTFVQHFVNLVGGKGQTQKGALSPTYSVVNDYGKIVHADFYRLKSAEEIVHLELSLYLEGKDYFLVEWGAKYAEELYRQLDFEVDFFELKIDIAEGSAPCLNGLPRNYHLYELTDFE